MTIRRAGTETTQALQARLCRRFPERSADVTRQIGLAVACAEQIGLKVTPDVLEGLVIEHLHAMITDRRAPRAAAPSVPHMEHAALAHA